MRFEIESLESRRHLAADLPYNVSNGVIVGQFMNAVPSTLVGGSTIKLQLKITNTSKVPQRGLIDITYVLDKAVTGQSAVADKFDAKLAQTTNVLLNLKGKSSQTFKVTGLIPDSLTTADYWIAASVDTGGTIAQNAGFQSTVAGTVAHYIPAYTDVTVSNFSVKTKKFGSVVSGNLTGTLKNFGNSSATGTVVLKVYGSAARAVGSNDVFISQLSVSLEGLASGKTKSVKIPFDSPSGLVAGQQYYVRIELIRSGLPKDADFDENRNVFSLKPVTLS